MSVEINPKMDVNKSLGKRWLWVLLLLVVAALGYWYMHKDDKSIKTGDNSPVNSGSGTQNIDDHSQNYYYLPGKKIPDTSKKEYLAQVGSTHNNGKTVKVDGIVVDSADNIVDDSGSKSIDVHNVRAKKLKNVVKSR